MITVGVDIVEVPRIAHAVERWGERFLQHVYSANEVAFCQGRVPELAARFAGKEAISKALGTGIAGICWCEMEIMPDPLGKPLVQLYGLAAERARFLGLTQFAISLSHTLEYAVAFVVAE
jgi:holo-[acyl-carrier protein] synthase